MTNRLPLLTALLALAIPLSEASAHGDGAQPLFVANDGVDTGDCLDAASPCRTIGYALDRVGKNGQIRVAEGAYDVDGAEDLFRVVSGDVDIQGGYDPDGGFARSASGPSTLTGVPMEHSASLAERGFHVVVDQKGFDIDAARQTAEMLALHEKLQASMPATPCVGGSAGGLPCSDIDLLSHVGFVDISARPQNAADVWGFVDLNTNREYAIVGFDIGTGVFDVTDPENPREVGFIDGQRTTWRDIKVYQYWNATDGRWNAQAYVTTDGAADGLFIVDLSGLPQRIQRSFYSGDFTAAHNVYATNTDFATGLSLNGNLPTLIIAGSNNGQGPYRAYSVNAPSSPAFEIMPGSGRSDYMHDAASMIITDDRKDTQCVNATSYCEVLFDFNESTIDVWDITNTNNPVRLSRTTYGNAEYVHSGWWSEDKQYLYVHDELDERDRGLNTTLRVYSLADLTSPVNVRTWTGPTRAIDHNGFVRGNRYYMSNYTRGLTVLDLTDPSNPQTVGRLDTYPASDGNGFSGAWGAYPFFHSGAVAISDINSGLYLASDQSLDVPQGTLAFSATSYGASEGTQIQVPVTRSGGTTGAVTVGYEIVPATADLNDIVINSGILSWSDGDASDKLITLDLVNDTQAEDLERLLLRLVAPTGGATLAPGSVASIYVAEVGIASSVAFDSASIETDERSFAMAVVVVQRRGSAAGAASIDFSMTAGDADAGVDFTGPTSGTLHWADGDADPKWIELVIADDGLVENDEFVELSLSNAVGASLGARTSVTIDIADGAGINNAPNAVAGVNQTVASGAAVTLSGTQSNDPDGDAITYLWEQIAGTAVTLNGAGTDTATFTAPTVTSDTLLQFRLTVTDIAGLSSQSVTSVTVQRSGGGNGLGGGGGGGGAIGLLMLLALVAVKLAGTTEKSLTGSKRSEASPRYV